MFHIAPLKRHDDVKIELSIPVKRKTFSINVEKNRIEHSILPPSTTRAVLKTLFCAPHGQSVGLIKDFSLICILFTTLH